MRRFVTMDVAGARRVWRRLWNGQGITAALMLAPLLLLIGVFQYLSIIYALRISLTDWTGLSSTRTWVGLRNYVQLLRDPTVWGAFGNTVYYAGLIVLVALPIALALALAINHGRVRGVGFLRTALFAPNVTAAVAISIVWMWMYNPYAGVLNWLLELVGLPPQRWLLDPKLAMVSVAAVSIWKNVGYYMLLFLAGLQAIPVQFYEAGKVDGATGWAAFRHITLPLLRPTTAFVVITTVIAALQVFAEVYVMTQGGPSGSTDVVVYHVYDLAFVRFQYAQACALSFLLFAVILALTLLQKRVIGTELMY